MPDITASLKRSGACLPYWTENRLRATTIIFTFVITESSVLHIEGTTIYCWINERSFLTFSDEWPMIYS